jgi:hypothetical protein
VTRRYPPNILPRPWSGPHSPDPNWQTPPEPGQSPRYLAHSATRTGPPTPRRASSGRAGSPSVLRSRTGCRSVRYRQRRAPGSRPEGSSLRCRQCRSVSARSAAKARRAVPNPRARGRAKWTASREEAPRGGSSRSRERCPCTASATESAQRAGGDRESPGPSGTRSVARSGTRYRRGYPRRSPQRRTAW